MLFQTCKENDCWRKASFGPNGNLERCEIHRKEDDMNCIDVVCVINKCENYPTFGDGEKRYRCGSHRANNDISMGKVKDGIPFCTVTGCQYMRRFGLNGDIKRCLVHKIDGDKEENISYCVVEGCNMKFPIYKRMGTKSGTHCYEHRPYGYVSIKTVTCIEKDCYTSARFGKNCDGIKLHCYNHRQIDEINLASKLCDINGCFMDRTYGPVGQKKIRCENHRLENDVGIQMNKICTSAMCKTQPSFGPPGGSILKCHKHRLENHVNLKNINCDGGSRLIYCDKMPTFGSPGGKRLRCGKHALPGEVNLVKKVCIRVGCTKPAFFGPALWKRRRCNEHRTQRDVYAVGRRKSSKRNDDIDSEEDIFSAEEIREKLKDVDVNIFGDFNEEVTFSDSLV